MKISNPAAPPNSGIHTIQKSLHQLLRVRKQKSAFSEVFWQHYWKVYSSYIPFSSCRKHADVSSLLLKVYTMRRIKIMQLPVHQLAEMSGLVIIVLRNKTKPRQNQKVLSNRSKNKCFTWSWNSLWVPERINGFLHRAKVIEFNSFFSELSVGKNFYQCTDGKSHDGWFHFFCQRIIFSKWLLKPFRPKDRIVSKNLSNSSFLLQGFLLRQFLQTDTPWPFIAKAMTVLNPCLSGPESEFPSRAFIAYPYFGWSRPRFSCISSRVDSRSPFKAATSSLVSSAKQSTPKLSRTYRAFWKALNILVCHLFSGNSTVQRYPLKWNDFNLFLPGQLSPPRIFLVNYW